MKGNNISRYVVIGLAVFSMAMVSGCATTDTVSSRFPEVQDNISAAKKAEAEVYAPTALKSAEAKLAEAKQAVRANDMITANRLVDEAMVDADYARAKAPTEKARKEIVRLRESIQAVRDEIRQMPAVK